MNNLKKNKLLICIVIYVIIAFTIFLIKPKSMFKENNIIPFGVEKNSTIISYPVLLIILAISIYFICHLF